MIEVPKLLKKTSWSSKRRIAESVEENPSNLNNILNELLASRKIKRHGARRNALYTITGDKTPA